jgi:hypothetical protein
VPITSIKRSAGHRGHPDLKPRPPPAADRQGTEKLTVIPCRATAMPTATLWSRMAQVDPRRGAAGTLCRWSHINRGSQQFISSSRCMATYRLVNRDAHWQHRSRCRSRCLVVTVVRRQVVITRSPRASPIHVAIDRRRQTAKIWPLITLNNSEPYARLPKELNMQPDQRVSWHRSVNRRCEVALKHRLRIRPDVAQVNRDPFARRREVLLHGSVGH